MFEKLITDLKNSLPAPIRKKLGMAEENDNSEESEAEEVDSNEESENSASSSPASSAEEQKKKRNSMIVRVVVILALGYFAVDEFVLKPNQVNEEVPVFVPKRKRPVKKVPPAETAATATTPAADATATTPDANTPVVDAKVETTQTPQDTQGAGGSELSAYESTGTTGSAETTTAPIENVNVLSKNETPDQKIDQLLNEVDASSESSSGSASSASSPASKTTEAPEATSSPSVSETTTAQDAFTPTVDTSMEIPTELPAEQIMIPSQPKKAQGSKNGNSSMASKITEDSVETPPPAYDQVGRGLVYNCKDKYWACLDKTAYVVCNKNMKWNKSKGEPAECVVQNIYSSDEDCAKIQKYNVSTNVATNFCQN